MQPPSLPADEQQRLNALRASELLDTPPEERFDRLTRLAQRLFGVPIALVSLVDAERQWFKSRQGLDACETGRDISFCGHTILGDEIFEVVDARLDPRFADNPLVTGPPHIRFYVGAPLSTRAGLRLGTLCLIDRQPRQLSAEDRLALRELADCVEAEINGLRERKLHALLTASEARSATLLQTLPDIVFVVDGEGYFLDCNDHPDLILPRNQLLGRRLGEVLPAALAAQCMGAIGQTLAQGVPVNFEYNLDLPSGCAWFEARLQKLDDSDVLAIIRNVSREKAAEAELKRQKQMAEIIARAQLQFIREDDRRRAFDGLLNDILALTGSEYGFIGEVLRTPDGAPYLKSYAITNIAWDDATRTFYAENAPKGMEFFNLKTLFGAAMTSGEPVIANDPYHDPRRGGLPPGHPALDAFLGIPVHHGGELLGMVGLANRTGGYDQKLVEFLHPLLVTLGQLIDAARIKRQHLEDQATLARLSRVASQTTNGVVITDVGGRVEWVNEGFTRLTSYTLEEMRGRKPGDVLQGAQTDGATVAAMREALFRHEGFVVDVVNCAKDGRPYWVRIDCNPLRDADGVLQGFMAIESDITQQKQAELKLRETTRLLESIFENVPSMIFLKNAADLRFKYFNRAGEALVGHGRDELIGRNDHDFFPREQADFFTGKDRAVLAQSGVVDIPEEEINTPHGKRILHTRKLAVRDEQGKPQYLLGISDDITDQKQAEQALQQSEARLRGLFELSPVGIALNDYETGAFIEVNDALLAPTGYAREEFLQLSYWDLTPREYEADEARQLDSLAHTGRYGPYEKEYVRKDGSRYPVLLNGTLVHDASGRKLIWSIIEDITERKRVERMKNEFVSTVSHELRTPLTSIAGALGLVQGGVLGELSPQARQMIEIAHKNSERLGHLINDLLDMEKLMAGKMVFDLQVQPLMPLIEQALRDNQAYADQYDVRLIPAQTCDAAQVEVDGLRLQQVLANLLSNAAKFSPRGGEVTLTVRCHDGRVRVAVSDRGPGIPEAFRARIFEKFSQADASDARQKGGTGLGLAITRELVERMGGTIDFESLPGDGTTFFFELPIRQGGRS